MRKKNRRRQRKREDNRRNISIIKEEKSGFKKVSVKISKII
jgi:hypothetical protein